MLTQFGGSFWFLALKEIRVVDDLSQLDEDVLVVGD